jgi:hypothetical protein
VPERVTVKWANPDRSVPHGTAKEIRMSVGDDVERYLVLLVVGPMVGVMPGTVGAAMQLRERHPNVDAVEDNAQADSRGKG